MAQTSLAGQLLIGTLSASGSGIIYRWMMAAWNYELYRNQAISEVKSIAQDLEPTKKTSEPILFPDPGYDAKVSFLAAFVAVCLMDQGYFTFISSALQNVSLIPSYLNSNGLPAKGEVSVVIAFIFIISGILRPQKE